MNVKVYVEGGGESHDLKSECRRGFREFLGKAGFHGQMPRIIACGSRNNTYDDFCRALRVAGDDEFVVLLVDSERDMEPGKTPWQHLSDALKDGWLRPATAEDDNAHLMVQCMEAWFLADRETLARFYGDGFRDGALPANPHLGQIPKADLIRALEEATRRTGKAKYSKGGHSFKILAEIDMASVLNGCPDAAALVETLRRRISAST